MFSAWVAERRLPCSWTRGRTGRPGRRGSEGSAGVSLRGGRERSQAWPRPGMLRVPSQLHEPAGRLSAGVLCWTVALNRASRVWAVRSVWRGFVPARSRSSSVSSWTRAAIGSRKKPRSPFKSPVASTTPRAQQAHAVFRFVLTQFWPPDRRNRRRRAEKGNSEREMGLSHALRMGPVPLPSAKQYVSQLR